MLQSHTSTQTSSQAFVEARKEAKCLPVFPGTPPTDLASAYALQDEAIALFDGTIIGWKVGRIQPPLSDSLGTTRLFGPAWAEARQDATNGHVPTGRIFKGGFGAVEAEFMFRIGQVPPSGQTRISLDEVAGLIDAVYVGFEIASSPYAGINSSGPLVTICDFGNNNGLLVGPEVPEWRASGLADWTVETRADGILLGSGKASAFPDGPLGSVKLLIENLIERGHPIVPGLLISTGAVSGVHEVTAGQKIEARFGDDMVISCTIDYAKPQ